VNFNEAIFNSGVVTHWQSDSMLHPTHKALQSDISAASLNKGTDGVVLPDTIEVAGIPLQLQA
jgi:hypothetical protein